MNYMIFLIKKINMEEAAIISGSLKSVAANGLAWFQKDAFDFKADAGLRRIFYEAPVTERYIDMEKLMKIYKIPMDAEDAGQIYGRGRAQFLFLLPDGRKRKISITKRRMERDFLKAVVNNKLVCRIAKKVSSSVCDTEIERMVENLDAGNKAAYKMAGSEMERAMRRKQIILPNESFDAILVRRYAV